MLGLTAASVVFVVGMDAVRFHAAALVRCACHVTLTGMPVEGWVLAALGLLDGVVIVRAVRSLARQLIEHRRLLRSLPACREMRLGGHAARVLPTTGAHAFCAGLFRPVVYVSEGLLHGSTAAELQAIVAHEAHHRGRRDPLRLLLARVVSDAFRPLPPLARLAERQRAVTELAADAAAIRALGSIQPLASALVRFDDLHAVAGGGVAPERVDQLVRRRPLDGGSAWLLAAAALALAGIAAPALAMLLVGRHPAPVLPIGLELAAIAAACVPAYCAARRTEECLRPAI